LSIPRPLAVTSKPPECASVTGCSSNDYLLLTVGETALHLSSLVSVFRRSDLNRLSSRRRFRQLPARSRKNLSPIYRRYAVEADSSCAHRAPRTTRRAPPRRHRGHDMRGPLWLGADRPAARCTGATLLLGGGSAHPNLARCPAHRPGTLRHPSGHGGGLSLAVSQQQSPNVRGARRPGDAGRGAKGS
jgi:hypothetical protein